MNYQLSPFSFELKERSEAVLVAEAEGITFQIELSNRTIHHSPITINNPSAN